MADSGRNTTLAGPALRHVVWDWNGTLLDDFRLCLDVINGLLAENGLPALSAQRYRAVFGFPVRDYYIRAGFDLEKCSFEGLGIEFTKRYYARLDECGLRAGARGVLERLSSAGLTQSVLSACEQGSLESAVRDFGLDGFFTGLSGADDHYAHGKADRGENWIERLTYDRRRVVMIGDTAHDVDTAKAMGCAVILVQGGHQSACRLEKCGVPVVGNLRDIPAFLGFA